MATLQPGYVPYTVWVFSCVLYTSATSTGVEGGRMPVEECHFWWGENYFLICSKGLYARVVALKINKLSFGQPNSELPDDLCKQC